MVEHDHFGDSEQVGFLSRKERVGQTLQDLMFDGLPYAGRGASGIVRESELEQFCSNDNKLVFTT